MCKDEDGCTPLHSAFCLSSLAIVKFLIGKSKADAVQMENNFKETPLHMAFLENKHEAVPEFVATKYPDFLKKPKPSDGRLPLHVACAIAQSIVAIQVLLEHYPDAARQKDKQGKLPLALACKNETLISEGGKCTLGVHLSWEYYIVFIYVVLYQLECAIYIFMLNICTSLPYVL